MSDKIIRRKGNTLTMSPGTLGKPYAPVYDFPEYGDLGEVISNFGSVLKNGLKKDNQDSLMDTFQIFQPGQNSYNSNADSSQVQASLGKFASKLGSVNKVMGTAGSFLKTGTNAVDAFKYASAMKDTSGIESDIAGVRNFQTNAGTLDELQFAGNGIIGLSSIDSGDLRAHNGWQTAGHTLAKMGQTFATAKGGLFSKLAQTAAVGLSGAAGAIVGNQKIHDAMALFNAQQDDARLAANSAMDYSKNLMYNNAFKQHMINGIVGAYGGKLNLTGDFTNGLTFVNEGGSHEQNPREGVVMGTAPDGSPNLVEQGETIYKDKVFSNRLYAKGGELDEMFLPDKLRNRTFAKAAEDLGKESQERPNDPISRRTLEANLDRLFAVQEKQKEKKREQEARKQFESLSPEEQQALVQNAQQNLADEQYAQQQEQLAQQQAMEQMNAGPEGQMAAFGGRLYSKGGPKKIRLESEEAEARRIAKADADPYYADTDAANYEDWQVPFRQFYKNWESEFYANNPWAKPKSPTVSSSDNGSEYQPLPTGMRYAPVYGSAVSVINDLFGGNRPDYTAARRMESAARNLGRVGFSPIGNYLPYDPVDRNYYLTQMNNAALASRRGLLGTNRGMANAALLASQYQNQNSIGDALIKMDEANLNARMKSIENNKGVDSFNSEGSMKAQTANLDRDTKQLAGIEAALQMMNNERLRGNEQYSADFTNFFDNLGKIGKENMTFNMVNSNKSQYYGIRPNGEVYYKPSYYKLNSSDRAAVDNYLSGITAPFGGRLTVKNKKNRRG